jgi:hypothetical protein
MFRNLLRNKRALGVLGVMAALAIASAAFAYFTSEGSGTGNGAVGSSSNYAVTVDAATSGSLYPGSGVDTLAYHVKNESTGHQQVSSITAALTVNGEGDVFDTIAKASATGCKASWFTVVNSPGTLPDDLAGGATHDGSATVALKDEETNQNACQGVDPQLTVNAS